MTPMLDFLKEYSEELTALLPADQLITYSLMLTASVANADEYLCPLD